MFRSIFLPALIACAIVGPVIYEKSKRMPAVDRGSQNPAVTNNQLSSVYGGSVAPQPFYHPVSTPNNGSPPMMAASNTTTLGNAPAGNARLGNIHANVPSVNGQINRPASASINQTQPFALPTASTNPPAFNASTSSANATTGMQTSIQPGSQPAPISAFPISAFPISAVPFAQPQTVAPNLAGLTPDFGAAETKVFRGTAAGPDLNAAPLSFVPINDFREVFRFNIDQQWIKNRFERISTTPAESGLHGLRTALVTGTNSWDLHGSQTWYFDAHQRLQRISFRGWVGDPERLLQLATQHFGLKQQPTHWAGLYTGNFGGKLTGGMVMKDPDVIDRRNQVQRTAVLMEINLPSGGFEISDQFRGLIMSAAAQ